MDLFALQIKYFGNGVLVCGASLIIGALMWGSIAVGALPTGYGILFLLIGLICRRAAKARQDELSKTFARRTITKLNRQIENDMAEDDE